MDYDIIAENIEENHFKGSKEFMNGENIFRNKNNRRNCDELKYKVFEDKNINNANLGGSEHILRNNGNLIKNII